MISNITIQSERQIVLEKKNIRIHISINEGTFKLLNE